MGGMFTRAEAFNSDISKWDVRKVVTMDLIFHGCKSFSQTLCGHWKTSKPVAVLKVDIFGDSLGKMC